MLLATISDAPKLLEIQKEAFKIYSDKYGDFDSNPYHMDLNRMEFNVKYRYGQYYKIMNEDTNKIVQSSLLVFHQVQKQRFHQ